jgi:hypothetical protein
MSRLPSQTSRRSDLLIIRIWFGMIAGVARSGLFARLHLAVFGLGRMHFQIEADGGNANAAKSCHAGVGNISYHSQNPLLAGPSHAAHHREPEAWRPRDALQPFRAAAV